MRAKFKQNYSNFTSVTLKENLFFLEISFTPSLFLLFSLFLSLSNPPLLCISRTWLSLCSVIFTPVRQYRFPGFPATFFQPSPSATICLCLACTFLCNHILLWKITNTQIISWQRPGWAKQNVAPNCLPYFFEWNLYPPLHSRCRPLPAPPFCL